MGVAKDSDKGFWRKSVTDFRYLTLVWVVFLAFFKCFRRYSCGGLAVVATPKAVSYRVYEVFRLTYTLNIDHWDTQYIVGVYAKNSARRRNGPLQQVPDKQKAIWP